MRKQMTEEQAWEQLYGRRSPDVRVLGRRSLADDVDDGEPRRREHPVAQADPQAPSSEAHAA